MISQQKNSQLSQNNNNSGAKSQVSAFNKPQNPKQQQSRISFVNTSEFQNPINSRILNRKQIQKRIQAMKPQQYQRVINNLTNQNGRLKQQVKNLHEKVEQLIINKKLPKSNSNTNKLIEQQLRKAKKQLSAKYDEMLEMKQEVSAHQMTNNMYITQEMRNKIRYNQNQVSNIQQQIKQTERQKKQIMEIFQGNCEDMEEFIPTKKQQLEDKINQLKDQNKQIKRKIMEISMESKKKDKNSQEVLDKFYNLKSEEGKFMQMLKTAKKNNITSKSKINMSDIKNVDVSQVPSLQIQIEKLRKLKKSTEKQLVNEKIHKEQKRTVLENQAKQLVEMHKQLQQKKMKFSSTLNLYEAKDKKHREMVDIKNLEKDVSYEEKTIQTDKIIPKDFRKEFIGKNQGIIFDDSLILDYRSQITIKSVLVYKTADFIVFPKFHYETSLKKRYDTKIPIDSTMLRKYDTKKFVAPSGCFLKSFKVSLTNDKITKISFIWSNGDISVQGWDMEGSVLYSADIGPDERPISMFGSIKFEGKNIYALECLGCQVNVIQND